MNVQDIREILKDKLDNEDFVIDKTGVKTIEIIGATFDATEDYIIRKPNYDYVARELQWYNSMSLNVDDIPNGAPAIWRQVSSENGEINSNYGWCIYHQDNFNQYINVVEELKANPNSRRASMLYTRPSMHYDYNRDGMSDFVCTFADQFFIRDNKLVSHYIMRSNDAVFGYCNDYAWAKHVQQKLARELGIECGDLIWTASSFHVYEQHFKFIK